MDNSIKERTLLLKIRKNVLIIEKILKKSISYDFAEQLDDRQLVRRRRLGVRHTKKLKPGIINRLKATGRMAIDRVLNFFLMILGGWIFTKILPVLPQLAKLLRLVKPIGDFIGLLAGALINSLSFFISGGYKIYDKINSKVNEIKNKPLTKAYKEFSDVADKLIDGKTSTDEKPTEPKPDQSKPKAAKTGGIPLTRGNEPVVKPIRRGTKVTKPIIVPRKQSTPEIVIADNVRSYYKSSDPKKIKRNTPADNILKISTLLKSPSILFGDLASAGTDISLGHKPGKGVYMNTAKDILQIIKVLTERTKQSIVSMDPDLKAINISNSQNIIDFIATVIQRSVESKFNRAVNDFRQSLLSAPGTKTDLPTPGINAPGVEGSMGFSGGYYGAYKPTSAIEKQIYDYLVNEKRMNDTQALGIMANIHRESTFRPSASSGNSFGLFQWKGARADAMMRSIPDWKTNWKKQIDYALTEPKNLSMVTPGKYTSLKFTTAEEAADWWAKEWERPANLSDAAIKHKRYLKSVPKSKDGLVKFREPEEPTKAELRTKGGASPSNFITSHFGMRKHPILGTYREHKGIDIAGDEFAEGKPISVIKSGVVAAVNDNPSAGGGYGKYVTIKHDDGSYSFYAHLNSVNVKRGDKISTKEGGVATVIGTLGSTGRSSGPHLHFEVGTGISGGFLTGQYDPKPVVSNYVRGGGKVEIVARTTKKLTMKNGIEGVTENGKWSPKKWTEEERQRYEKFNKIRKDTSSGIINEMLQNIPKNGTVEKLIRKPTTEKYVPSGYTSYERPGGASIIAIQPIIETRTVPVKVETPVPFPTQTSSNPTTNYRG